MDKFGIFKLLSSLGNANTAGSESSANPLSTILENLASKKQEEKPPEETFSDAPKSMHLTSPMLDTMKNHDEFLKRVKKGKP